MSNESEKKIWKKKTAELYALIFLASTTQRENKQVTERRLIRSQSSLILLLTVGARGVMGRRKVGQRLVDHFCFPPLKMPLVFCPKRAIQIESTEDKSGKAVYWRSASTIGRLPAVRHNSRCRFCCTHNFCTSAISLSLASLSLSHSASLLVHIRAASSLKIKEKRQQTSILKSPPYNWLLQDKLFHLYIVSPTNCSAVFAC